MMFLTVKRKNTKGRKKGKKMTERDMSVSIVRSLLHTVAFLTLSAGAAGLISEDSSLSFIIGLAILIGTVGFYIPKFFKFAQRNLTAISKALGVVLLTTALGMSTGCGYSRVEPGHVGIRVHLYGGHKGVDFEPVGVGAYWYNPWYTSIYEFPTYVQTARWTKSVDEGSSKNEELTFNTSEGMIVAVDISLSYHLDGEKVPAFFAKFRTDNLDTFTHGFMRNIARDGFNDIGALYPVEQVYGEKKEELRKKVAERVQSEVVQYGVVLEQFGYISAPRLPDKVVASLNAKIQATQDAMRIQNEVAQAEAEAKKTVAVANGAAQARIAIASAEAQANKTIAASLTPELVQYLYVQRWNGQRPTVEGSNAGLLLTLPPTGK